ncbi:type I restriction-modification system subunit M [Desulfosporosinus sp. OT]|uniref:type I restriction-modification system subunit M n=1 Tax=Desulfosporosinus sp. OT TaxID=913865 RepID=UPI000223A184|nr:type I restriction-modification system subunit M [Desulfosporosinus sp. OT]EGW38488.1 type I restriction-modification system, M subunit [Desulfosporosinus sp. OT]
MNKQKLATKIWETANKMRSKIEANEYKDYILGFIFYKYLSDKEVKFLKDNDFSDSNIKNVTEADAETVKFVQQGIGYFIAYNDLFSTWLEMEKDFNVGNVRDALSAFSRLINNSHKKVFDGIFETLQTGLSKLGDSAASQTKAIGDLIQLIKDIPMDGKQDYDVLGFIYEYLISMFAANAGKKAGEFYTPHEVSLLMSKIVAEHVSGKTELKIYDPTSGSGSLLINIGQAVAKYIDNPDKIEYYAQELKKNTYNLTRMNLVMRGISPYNIKTRNGDTLEEDWPYFDESDPVASYDPLYVDAVVSNPPYSQHWDPANKDADSRYKRFGLAPKSKADYAFLLHDLYHLKPSGIMTIVLPHGVLFRGGEEGLIRKNLIEQNHIDTIIGLPSNIFFGTGIPTIILVLKQKRDNTDVLIIDASKGFAKEGKNNKLRESDIKRIVDTIVCRPDVVPKYAKKVSRETIRENEYNLNIPRYVDSANDAETWDIYASMFGGIPKSEALLLDRYWEALPGLYEAIFTDDGTPYLSVAINDVKNDVENNVAVKQFKGTFDFAFMSFPDFLYEELINKMETVEISKEETEVANNIFERLKDIPLIDKYVAFQMLSDEWTKISIDLEIIQTEGFEAAKKVEPNMVTKKKGDKEVEIQDGWIGHVIPFEIVQATLLKEDSDALQAKEARIIEISEKYAEIIDSFSEEDKESDVLNEAKDAFVTKEIAAKVKEIDKATLDEFECSIILVSRLMGEEKILKAEIKRDAEILHIKTKDTIEGLSNAQVIELLELKWIRPLVSNLNTLPTAIIEELISYFQVLSGKYAVTYSAIEEQISETQDALSALIDELTGNKFDMKGLSEFQKLLKGE